jgi:myo-inositol 2-dehydrogenase / D-chiro-inositol 1-dehydrogenase
MNSNVSIGPKAYTWDALPQPRPDANGFYPVPVPGDPEWFKKIV